MVYSRPSEALAAHAEEVKSLLGSAGMRNVRVFGSIARGEDTPTSDVDLLVDFAPGTNGLDVADAWAHLVEILGFSVDIVSPDKLKPRYRKILNEAVAL